jgi:regulator of RNase E activity RraB
MPLNRLYAMALEDNEDATRDALARIISQGADPSQPIVFDFFVDAADLSTTLRVVEALAGAGFDPHYWQNEPLDDEAPDNLRWTVEISLTLPPQFEHVQPIEVKLAQLARAAGGAYDGFGSYGEPPDQG